MRWLRSWKLWLLYGVLACGLGLLAYGFWLDPKYVASPLVGKKAANFTLKRLGSSESLTLEQLRGKPVILNFWASWCVECQSEASVLEAFYQAYDVSQQQVHVVGIAIQDTEEQAQTFASQFGKTYFLGRDLEGKISLEYGVYGVPETFLIDAQGVIRSKVVGGVSFKRLEEEMLKMHSGLTQTAK